MIDFKTQKFAVIGIGDTGLSIINYLHSQNAQIVSICDTRDNPPQLGAVKATLKTLDNNQNWIPDRVRDDEVPLYLGKLNYSQLSIADIIVISPGVSIYDEALQTALRHNKQVIGDIELFAHAIRDWNSKIIGVTGSNGKTTVTALTGFLLEKLSQNTLVAGNIGIPVLTSYLDILKSGAIPEAIVLELSSFQLETLYSLHFDAATVLNISEDHLDRYRDLLEYAYAKSNIFNHCRVQVLNRDDPLTVAMARGGKLVLWFGAGDDNKFTLKKQSVSLYHKIDPGLRRDDDSAVWDDSSVVRDDDKPGDVGVLHLQVGQQTLIPVSELQLVGTHNYFNVLASLALLDAIGIDVSQDAIRQGLREFAGLEHRMQKVLEHDGVLYIEDSKGTNVGAVVAGISGLDRPVHLILGGDGKGQDFVPLRALVMNKCKSVALIGQDKELIADVLAGISIPVEKFATLESAVTFCMKNARAGDCVALSPACASWDMFTNYKERAQVFRDSVYANIK